MARRASRSLKFLLALLGLAVVAYLSRSLWLRALSRGLVHDDGPAKADIAVVLAGDYYGNRILAAGELVRRGYVPIALIDGPAGFFGTHESTLAIRYAVAQGDPQAWFIDFPIQSMSTREEAAAVLPELRRRNVRSYLLVTSDFHSGRARRIFRATQHAMGYNPDVKVVVSHSPEFDIDRWWQYREGKKAVFIEWCKTIATAIGE